MINGSRSAPRRRGERILRHHVGQRLRQRRRRAARRRARRRVVSASRVPGSALADVRRSSRPPGRSSRRRMSCPGTTRASCRRSGPAAHVAERRDADEDARDHERHDDHRDEPDEHRADRLETDHGTCIDAAPGASRATTRPASSPRESSCRASPEPGDRRRRTRRARRERRERPLDVRHANVAHVADAKGGRLVLTQPRGRENAARLMLSRSGWARCPRRRERGQRRRVATNRRTLRRDPIAAAPVRAVRPSPRAGRIRSLALPRASCATPRRPAARSARAACPVFPDGPHRC